ncbi:hypothetical protein BGZ83_004667 [Gryganskiella cystojenkinii]|nr:hypothetical protein BGZ83_004667 [Gryganskiella cystojenkinii]
MEGVEVYVQRDFLAKASTLIESHIMDGQPNLHTQLHAAAASSNQQPLGHGNIKKAESILLRQGLAFIPFTPASKKHSIHTLFAELLLPSSDPVTKIVINCKDINVFGSPFAFQPLCQKLNVDVVLLSTKAPPRVYTCAAPRMTIGLIHTTAANLSQYMVLTSADRPCPLKPPSSPLLDPFVGYLERPPWSLPLPSSLRSASVTSIKDSATLIEETLDTMTNSVDRASSSSHYISPSSKTVSPSAWVQVPIDPVAYSRHYPETIHFQQDLFDIKTNIQEYEPAYFREHRRPSTTTTEEKFDVFKHINPQACVGLMEEEVKAHLRTEVEEAIKLAKSNVNKDSSKSLEGELYSCLGTVRLDKKDGKKKAGATPKGSRQRIARKLCETNANTKYQVKDTHVDAMLQKSKSTATVLRKKILDDDVQWGKICDDVLAKLENQEEEKKKAAQSRSSAKGKKRMHDPANGPEPTESDLVTHQSNSDPLPTSGTVSTPSNQNEVDDDESEDETGTVNKKEIRSTTANLRNILRVEHLVHFDKIVKALDEAQYGLSTVVEELQLVTFKFLIELGRGAVAYMVPKEDLNDETGKPRPRSKRAEEIEEINLSQSQRVDLRDFFGPDFVIRDDKLRDEPLIDVAVISNDLIQRITTGLEKIHARKAQGLTPWDKDVLEILNQNCVSFLGTRSFGRYNATREGNKAKVTRTLDEKDHPVWSQGLPSLSSDKPKFLVPDGLATTMTAFDRQLSTDISNIFQGSTYFKLLKHGIKIALRLRIRPHKEAHGRAIREKHVQEKTKRSRLLEENGITDEGGRRRKWRKRAITLFNKLDSEWSKSKVGPPRALENLLRSIVVHQDRRSSCFTSRESIPLAKEDPSWNTQEDDALSDVEDEESEADSCNNNNNQPESEADKIARLAEPNQKQMNRLESLCQKIILDGTLATIDSAYIWNKLYKADDFTADQIEAATDICNRFRLHSAKKLKSTDTFIRHPFLFAPLIHLMNALLRAAGYKKFTRRLAPLSSCGKLQSLPLNATSIFMTLCNADPHRFDVKDRRRNCIITSGQDLSDPEIRRCVMHAILNVPKLQAICHQHGLSFSKRMDYVDKTTIRLRGTVLADHTLCKSEYKSNNEDKVQSTKKFWAAEVEDRGIGSSEAWEYAEVCKLNLVQWDSDVADAKKELSPLSKSREGADVAFRHMQQQIRKKQQQERQAKNKDKRSAASEYLAEELRAMDSDSEDMVVLEEANADSVLDDIFILYTTKSSLWYDLQGRRTAERPLLIDVSSKEHDRQCSKDDGYYWRNYAEAAERAEAAKTEAEATVTVPVEPSFLAVDPKGSSSSPSPQKRPKKSSASKKSDTAKPVVGSESKTMDATAARSSNSSRNPRALTSASTSASLTTLETKLSEPTLDNLGMQQTASRTSLVKLYQKVSTINKHSNEVIANEQDLKDSFSRLSLMDHHLKEDPIPVVDAGKVSGLDVAEVLVETMDGSINADLSKPTVYSETCVSFDPGLCTMMDGVAMRREDVHRIMTTCHGTLPLDHMSPAEILEQGNNESTPESATLTDILAEEMTPLVSYYEERKKRLEEIKISGQLKLSAKCLYVTTGSQKLARVRRRKEQDHGLEERADRKEIHNQNQIILNTACREHSTMVEQLEERSMSFRSARPVLQKFNRMMSAAKRHYELEKKRAYDQLCSKQRSDALVLAQERIGADEDVDSRGFCISCRSFHFVENRYGTLVYPKMCPKTHKNLTVMYVGDAGTGLNSRIGGHLRWGGNKVCENHMRFIPVLMTDEYLTTKTCPFCWRRVRFGRARTDKGVRSVKGVIQCKNPKCLSFKLGYSKRARDTNAAFNIMLRGEIQVSSEDRKIPDAFARRRRAELPIIHHGRDATAKGVVGDVVMKEM